MAWNITQNNYMWNNTYYENLWNKNSETENYGTVNDWLEANNVHNDRPHRTTSYNLRIPAGSIILLVVVIIFAVIRASMRNCKSSNAPGRPILQRNINADPFTASVVPLNASELSSVVVDSGMDNRQNNVQGTERQLPSYQEAVRSPPSLSQRNQSQPPSYFESLHM